MSKDIIFKRSIEWQEHNPQKVDVIGRVANKKSNDAILEVEGEMISPEQAFDMAKNQGNKKAAFAYAVHVIESNPQNMRTSFHSIKTETLF